MKLIPSRVSPSALLGAFVASAVLIGGALAQPPKPGGPGGGAPGPGPGAGPSGPGTGPGGPGAGPGGPGPGAGGPSPTFILRFCNKSADTPVIFVSVASIVGQQFRAAGWLQVPQGQCVQAGSFQRPAVWWHARSPAGGIWGDVKSGVDLCVNLNGGFDYTWDGAGRQCGQGETHAPFIKIEIKPNVGTFDMTLN